MRRLFVGRASAFASVAMLCMCAATSAQGAIVSGSITGGSVLSTGTFVVLNPDASPFSIGADNLNTNNLYTFSERTNIQLTSDLALDVGGTIAAGTWIDTYLIAFDPLGEESVAGTVSFSSKVLGIDRRAVTLTARNSQFGSPSVTYLTPIGFALDPGVDFVNPAKPNEKSVRILNLEAGTPGDLFRVYTLGAGNPTNTAAVPEPASWAMMIAGFAFAGSTLRQQRARRMPTRAHAL